MNTELLERVIAHIQEEPRRFHMEYWFEEGTDEVSYLDDPPPCGTVGCISGWAANLSNTEVKVNGLHVREYLQAGQKALDIGTAQADRLFYVHNWPDRFRHAYIMSLTPEEAIKAAVERIRFFIKTNGTDHD